jgi:hypothetical protein
MPGEIRQSGDMFEVTCHAGCARPLSWTTTTRKHAENLLAKHLREYHPTGSGPEPEKHAREIAGLPDTLNLTAAARAAYDLDSIAALTIWCALTDTRPTEARALVTALAERGEIITAHVAPF